jgi:hypothetical protein
VLRGQRGGAIRFSAPMHSLQGANSSRASSGHRVNFDPCLCGRALSVQGTEKKGWKPVVSRQKLRC